MCLRAMAVALFVLIPNLVTGQTPAVPAAEGQERERLTLQFGAGPTLVDQGHTWSVAFGFLPASRIELLLNVERDRMAYQFERIGGANTVVRGGAMSFVSAETRVAMRPPDRVSPFAVAGVGGGVSRPGPSPRGSKDSLVLYAGGGVRVPIRPGLSLWSDARMIFEVKNVDGVPRTWPVRAGIAWRF